MVRYIVFVLKILNITEQPISSSDMGAYSAILAA